MEGHTIETLGVAADLGRDAFKRLGAGRQESKMASVWHHVILGLGRQSVVYILGMAWVRQDLVVVAAPELYRGLDVGKALRREGIADGGRRAPRRGEGPGVERR